MRFLLLAGALWLSFHGDTSGYSNYYDRYKRTLERALDELAKSQAEKADKHTGSDPDDKSWMKRCELAEKFDIEKVDQSDFENTVGVLLMKWNYCLKNWMAHLSYAEWNYVTDLTEEHKNKAGMVSVQFSKWHRQLSRYAQKIHNDTRCNDLDPDTKRQIRLFSQDASPQSDDDVRAVTDLGNDLEGIYSKAKIGEFALDPDLERMMAESRNPDLLRLVWEGWRDVSGAKMKDMYAKFVELVNSGARENNYKDYSQAWMEEQFDETPNLEDIAENLWQELKPLYKELHAFVRRKLFNFYKQKNPSYKIINEFGGIPAHLLGNMWAQDWSNIYDIVKPFPEVEEPDYDQVMKDQGYTVDDLFDTAEEFYTSIGMFPMTKKFQDYSMKVKPPPEEKREVVCHASAEDFYTENDFRIKMCTKIDIEDFETIHHEMGHIEYFMAYAHQPAIYRTGANSAFHEATGDTISHSVLSRKHLETIKLLKAGPSDNQEEKRKRDINFLLKRALSKIAFLPFGYMIDKWRWGVFKGEIKPEEYNRRWWEMRLEYQGLVAPSARTEEDFDPGAKYHIPSNSPYICYFISFIIQFQFYEAMCKESGHEGELYNCDFYKSKEAGTLFKNVLSLGKSKPWPEAMQAFTGSPNITTSSIKLYFEPLTNWLKLANEDASKIAGRNVVGWRDEAINWTDI